MRAERKRALIVYGDITGFATWARRTMPEDFLSLMQKVYSIYSGLKLFPGLFVKFFGDGFMVVLELDQPDEHAQIVALFRKLFFVARQVDRAIQATDFPRPLGFRMRAVIGPCWRIDYGDDGVDYLGYYVNFCSRLLGVAREIKLLVSDSVRQSFRKIHERTISFREFIFRDRVPRGVDIEDLKIWSGSEIKTKEKRDDGASAAMD